jgi:hypothetical protein
MKTLSVTLLIILIATCSYANQKAITDTGEEIIIYNNGTWKYSTASEQNQSEIKFNKRTFKTSKGSSFLLKSTKNNTAYWLNTSKWAFSKVASEVEAAEYEFELKGKDLYGMAITEEIEISIKSLTDIAFTNAKEVAPDIKVLKKEYRIVNGMKVIYMEMEGTLQGMNITYFGYYYSDTSGSTQFVVYTGTNLVKKYKAEIDDFLNGLVTQ